MRLNLIFFSAERQDKRYVIEARRPLINGLRAFFDVKTIYSDSYASLAETSGSTTDTNEELDAVYIASGGTEEMFLNVYPFLKQPLLILSDGLDNSFAAAMEISTWLSNNNIEYTFYNIPVEADRSYFQNLHTQIMETHHRLSVKEEIKGMNIGLIGGESPWLIASHIDKDYVASFLQIHFEEIKTEEVINRFYRIKGEKEIGTNDALFEKHRGLLIERSEADLADAIVMYYTLKEMCTEYALSALTVKCFDVIEKTGTTACLALALLNDEGIISGCEGDIPSLLSMLMLQKGFKRPVFMANPTSSDRAALTVDFSHCTVPLSMTDSYQLPSHYESSKGIGIKGVLPLDKYVVYKRGGKNLEKYDYFTGEIIANPDYKMRCRTQVRFRFENTEDFDRFMYCRLGNHFTIFKKGDF